MIDYVKIWPSGINAAKLKRSKLLDFKKVYDEKTNEASKKSWAHYRGLTFTIYDTGKVQVDGSLHYYSNKGVHNYDDFTFDRLRQVLKDLQDKFNIDPACAKVINLEVGVNIHPPIETINVLEALFMHKRIPFKWIAMPGTNAKYKQIEHMQYFLKAYDKAIQNNLECELFRWEIKMKKSSIIRKFGVVNLSDLLNASVLSRLGNHLVNVWEEVLFSDPTLLLPIVPQDKWLKVSHWKNPVYWNNLHEECRLKNKNKFNREVFLFKDLCQTHSHDIQYQIQQLIESKIEYLIYGETNIEGTIDSICLD